MVEQTALIPGRVEIHTASIGRKPLGELGSPEGMRAIARVLSAAADEIHPRYPSMGGRRYGAQYRRCVGDVVGGSIASRKLRSHV